MKITVVAVGKLKERFWADACAEYAKRLGAFATAKMVEVPDRDPAKFGGEDAGRATSLFFGRAIPTESPSFSTAHARWARHGCSRSSAPGILRAWHM